MKRITVLFVTLMMLFSTTVSLAANIRTSGDYTYTVKGNGTATITGYTGKHQDIILPNMIDGYTITTIGENAFAINKMPSEKVSVTLPETITSIEANAFLNRKVYSINLPNSLEYIGDGAFTGCENDIQFRISNNHPYYATIEGSLYYKADKKLIRWVVGSEIPNGIVSLGDYSFASIDNGRVAIPATVSKIGIGAFYDSDIEIVFSNEGIIKNIPEWAFGRKSSHLRAIYKLPTGVENIGDYAFKSATIECNLNEFLKSVESIGSYAFHDCHYWYSSSVSGIDIPSTCKTIGEGAFEDFSRPYTDIRKITLANGIERIEARAFQFDKSCLNFDNVYLPESIKYIAYDAFPSGMTFTVEKGSYAERWAKENAFTYSIKGEEQNLDWLTGGSTQIAEEKKNAIPAGYHEVVGVGKGMMGDIEVKVITNENKIISVEVLSCKDTPGICDFPIKEVPPRIVANNSADVDCVAGATHTSQGIIDAVKNALKQLEN